MAFKIARSLWVLAAVAIFVATLRGFDGRPNSDIEVFLAWTMLTLGFPLSLVYPAAFAVIAELRETFTLAPLHVSYLSLSVAWSVLFALGYSQWFILMPRIVGSFRSWRNRVRR